MPLHQKEQQLKVTFFAILNEKYFKFKKPNPIFVFFKKTKIIITRPINLLILVEIAAPIIPKRGKPNRPG